MVEKTGHKKFMNIKRLEWIDEGKPKAARPEDEEDDISGGGNADNEERDAAKFPARVAPIFLNKEGERPKTPTQDDVPEDEEDLYGATPKASKPAQSNGGSLFGGGGDDAPDDDDLDALMAEEESQRTNTASTSIFGNGGGATTSSSRPIQKSHQIDDGDDDDLDALMAEAETSGALPSRPAPRKEHPEKEHESEDDLDAMMAESESLQVSKPVAKTAAPQDAADADEEAAMAEMDGLW